MTTIASNSLASAAARTGTALAPTFFAAAMLCATSASAAPGDDDLAPGISGTTDDAPDRVDVNADNDRDDDDPDDVVGMRERERGDDRRRDIDGAEGARLRVNVESELIGGAWTHRGDTLDIDGTIDEGDSLSFGAGLARPSLMDRTNAFSRPLLALGFGWVFARDRAILGAKLAITADGFGIQDSGRVTTVGGRVIPYFQWMFRRERAVRPYLEARVGVGGSAASRRIAGGGTATGHLLLPTAGVGFGLHLFPRDWFSVDLGLNADYAAAYGRTTFKGNGNDDTDWNKVADVVNFGVVLGMSAWF